MLVLAVDGEIIELVHVLQEPQVVMQSLRLLLVLHDLADVEELHVNRMHVHVLPLVLLQTEVGLLEGRLEDIRSVVFNRVLWNDLRGFLLLELVLQLLGAIIKILPNDITRLLLLRSLQALLPLYYRNFLLLQHRLIPDKVEHVSGPILDQSGEIIHAVLSDGLLLGVVLDGKHLADDGLLQHLD